MAPEGASPHYSELELNFALSIVARVKWKQQLGIKMQVTLTVILECRQDSSLFSSKDADTDHIHSEAFLFGVLERV